MCRWPSLCLVKAGADILPLWLVPSEIFNIECFLFAVPAECGEGVR